MSRTMASRPVVRILIMNLEGFFENVNDVGGTAGGYPPEVRWHQVIGNRMITHGVTASGIARSCTQEREEGDRVHTRGVRGQSCLAW